VLNIADTLHTWCRAARLFALATVVQVGGSAPLPVGTALAVDTDSNAVGSVSGGGVEGAAYELCKQILESGEPPTRARFGYSDDDAFAVGLREYLARLRSLIGLDLGARTPEETALSITAEITAHAHQGSGAPLSWSTGPTYPRE
jgi:xanthine/CO dehydrogenase XdhC/CoxF family maturation factor